MTSRIDMLTNLARHHFDIAHSTPSADNRAVIARTMHAAIATAAAQMVAMESAKAVYDRIGTDDDPIKHEDGLIRPEGQQACGTCHGSMTTHEEDCAWMRSMRSAQRDAAGRDKPMRDVYGMQIDYCLGAASPAPIIEGTCLRRFFDEDARLGDGDSTVEDMLGELVRGYRLAQNAGLLDGSGPSDDVAERPIVAPVQRLVPFTTIRHTKDDLCAPFLKATRYASGDVRVEIIEPNSDPTERPRTLLSQVI